MASSHKRRIIAFNAGVWAFALGSAVALGYVLNRPVRTRGGAELIAPAASDTCAAETARGVLIVPPVTIVGSRSPGESARTSEPPPDIGR